VKGRCSFKARESSQADQDAAKSLFHSISTSYDRQGPSAGTSLDNTPPATAYVLSTCTSNAICQKASCHQTIQFSRSFSALTVDKLSAFLDSRHRRRCHSLEAWSPTCCCWIFLLVTNLQTAALLPSTFLQLPKRFAEKYQ